MTARTKNYVIFFSPGTFLSEQTRKDIATWDVEEAKRMALDIVERYDAKPYGFCFITRKRNDDEMDAKEVSRSGMYYLGGEVFTRAQIEERNDPDEAVLRSNMRSNGYDKIIVNTNSWKFTAPLLPKDTVLDFQIPNTDS